MFNLGPLEVLAILVVALVVFGPNRLPEIGKQVGKAVRELKKFQHSITSEVNSALDVKEVLKDETPEQRASRAAEENMKAAAERRAAEEKVGTQPVAEENAAMEGQESLFDGTPPAATPAPASNGAVAEPAPDETTPR